MARYQNNSFALLKELIDKKIIKVSPDFITESYFDFPSLPQDEGLLLNRLSGMLYGVIFGDLLGSAYEGIPFPKRSKLYGYVRDFPSGKKLFLTDDSQFTLLTVAFLVENDFEFNWSLLSGLFCKWGKRIRGIGNTVSKFLQNCSKTSIWYERSIDSAGNGALMRISPVVLPYVRKGVADKNLFADAILCGSLTHNDYASNASCAAFLYVLWHAICKSRLSALDIVTMFLDVFSNVEGKDGCYRLRKHSEAALKPMHKILKELICDVKEDNFKERLLYVGSGAYLLETLFSVLAFIKLYFDKDPLGMIIKAVNYTVDSDTIASILACLVGAYYGKEVFPSSWFSGLNPKIISFIEETLSCCLVQKEQTSLFLGLFFNRLYDLFCSYGYFSSPGGG